MCTPVGTCQYHCLVRASADILLACAILAMDGRMVLGSVRPASCFVYRRHSRWSAVGGGRCELAQGSDLPRLVAKTNPGLFSGVAVQYVYECEPRPKPRADGSSLLFKSAERVWQKRLYFFGKQFRFHNRQLIGQPNSAIGLHLLPWLKRLWRSQR